METQEVVVDSRADTTQEQRYEEELIAEARELFRENRIQSVTREHLRVLFKWLDGKVPQPELPAWNRDGTPF